MDNTTTFNLVIGICILFYICEPCFSFPELHCLSSLNSHVKEYFVGKCSTRRLQTRQVVAVIKHFLDVCKAHVFIQHRRAKWHSRSSCPATTSTLSAPSLQGKLKLLSQISTWKKKIWENLTWKHFVTHFVHYLPQDKNTEVLWIHPGYKSDGKILGFLLDILCGYAERILIEVSAFLMLMQIWFYFSLWLLWFFFFFFLI